MRKRGVLEHNKKHGMGQGNGISGEGTEGRERGAASNPRERIFLGKGGEKVGNERVDGLPF